MMPYKVISYAPATHKNEQGILVIQVAGCKLTTSLDVPFGCIQGDDKWNAAVDPVVASVLNAMDPNSENYDASLVS